MCVRVETRGMQKGSRQRSIARRARDTKRISHRAETSTMSLKRYILPRSDLESVFHRVRAPFGACVRASTTKQLIILMNAVRDAPNKGHNCHYVVEAAGEGGRLPPEEYLLLAL